MRKFLMLTKCENHYVPMNEYTGLYMTHEEVRKYINCLNDYINNIDDKTIKKINIEREREKEESEKESLRKLEEKKLKSKVGYIYFVKTNTGSYKIGQTIDLKSRIKSFQAIDENIKLEYYIKVKNPLNVEKLFHDHYKGKHIKNELFRLNESDMKSIKEFDLPKEILANIV